MSNALPSPRGGLTLLEDEIPLASPLVLWAMRACAAAAVLLTSVLAFAAFTGSHVAGCGGEQSWFQCESVLSSRWSTWLRIPVSFPALSLYVSLLCGLCFTGKIAPPAVQRAAWMVVLCLATLAAGAGLWFVALQLGSLGKWCAYCLGVHGCGVVLAGLAWRFAPLEARPKGMLAGGAAAGLALLIGGQLIVPPPPTFAITQSDDPATQKVVALKPVGPEAAAGDKTSTSDPTKPADQAKPAVKIATPEAIASPKLPAKSAGPSDSTTGSGTRATPPKADLAGDLAVAGSSAASTVAAKPTTSGAEKPAKPAENKQRMIAVSVRDTRVELDVYEHPHVGNPEAPHFVVKLFDYTCHHCQALHGHLKAARERYGDQFVVVLLPVPMNTSCNSYLRSPTAEPHKTACELARYALAVHHARPDKFAEYDAFLFASPQPQPLHLAKTKAEDLIGVREFDRELNGRWVEEELKSGVRLYGLCYPQSSQIPKLLFGQIVSHGEMSAEELFSRLEHEWRIKPK